METKLVPLPLTPGGQARLPEKVYISRATTKRKENGGLRNREGGKGERRAVGEGRRRGKKREGRDGRRKARG